MISQFKMKRGHMLPWHSGFTVELGFVKLLPCTTQIRSEASSSWRNQGKLLLFCLENWGSRSWMPNFLPIVTHCKLLAWDEQLCFYRPGFSKCQVTVIYIKIIINVYLFLSKCCRVQVCNNCMEITLLKISQSQSDSHIKCHFLFLLDSELENASSVWSRHDTSVLGTAAVMIFLPLTPSGSLWGQKTSGNSSLDCDTHRLKNKSIRVWS